MICSMLPRARRVATYAARWAHSGSLAMPYDHKYAEKLQQKAKEQGLDLDELKLRAREEARCKQKEEAASLLASLRRLELTSRPNYPENPRQSNVRKDSSPVKPLSSILNISKLMATPHTPSQISTLWTAYHASRNHGTGRGYICASLPLECYHAMTRVAKRYPVFVVPVPRESTPDLSDGDSMGAAHEFFFLQWDFHPSSPTPSVIEPTPSEPVASCVPEPSTVLFTPLQEYKVRTSFAMPYLVLTFYTDLSQSHGIVLLRGEITPSSSSVAAPPTQGPSGRFFLSQVDAQLLAMRLQRFYLWNEGTQKGGHSLTAEALLKQFHEEPEKFNWQELLQLSNVVA